MEPVRLRRGMLARLRPAGFGSLIVWFVLGLCVWSFVSGEAGDAAWVYAVLGALAVLYRILTFVEFASADEAGLRWQSLAAGHHHRWHEVQLVEMAAKMLYVGRAGRTPMPCIQVHLRDGRSFWLLGSLGCEMDDIGEFIAAARNLTTYEWAAPGEPLEHRPHGRPAPTGSRVGRPTDDAARHLRRRRERRG